MWKLEKFYGLSCFGQFRVTMYAIHMHKTADEIFNVYAKSENKDFPDFIRCAEVGDFTAFNFFFELRTKNI